MKKRIILTEADIINIVKELLNEDIYTSPPNRRAIRYLIRNKGFNDEEAIRRLANGESIDDVFVKIKNIGEGFKRYELDGKYLILKPDNTFIIYNSKPMIFDGVSGFRDGFAVFEKNDKYNFIDTKGNILYKPNNEEEWFDFVWDFKNGFAWFKKNNKYNFINKDGNILYKPSNPDEWFDFVDNFHDGFAKIGKNNKYNFIDTKGNILYKPNNEEEWFDFVWDFKNGFAWFQKNNKYNYIDTKGNIYNENKELIEPNTEYQGETMAESIDRIISKYLSWL